MARCDFEIIDNDQDEPTDTHMYVLQEAADTHSCVQRRLTLIVAGNATRRLPALLFFRPLTC